MSSSSSSDEDFLPVGISMLNISSSKIGSPVMSQRTEDEASGCPSALGYFKLLTRAIEALNRQRSDDGEKLKLPLSVVRRSRKTFVNIVEVATRLNRQPEHMAHFISKGLFVEGSINKDGLLILDGSFLQSDVERVLRSFIEIYVVCKSCDSVDETNIVKENKLFFLRCEKCKSSRCVGNSIEGYTVKEKASHKLRGLI
ncbi:translation initiation factor 2 subunit 2 [Enteropsectra breve]|nr:translation initiation factor 2 subunit 2 [Enteropsectra breve]KAI5152269.1 translation initiation factor 2 subunit 2 [Enteropsectra breve]